MQQMDNPPLDSAAAARSKSILILIGQPQRADPCMMAGILARPYDAGINVREPDDGGDRATQ